MTYIAPPVHTVINVMLLSKPIIIVQTYKFFGYIVVRLYCSASISASLIYSYYRSTVRHDVIVPYTWHKRVYTCKHQYDNMVQII